MSDTSRPTLIVFGDDWGRNVSTMQHLTLQLLDRAEVIWIDAIGHREPRFSVGDLKRAALKGLAMLRRHGARAPAAANGARPQRMIAPRVLPWHRNPVVSRLNRWSLLHDIRRALAAASPRGPVILVTGSPPSACVVGACGEHASIYFCMDDFLEMAGTSHEMLAPLERALLGRVDAIVATARRLLETKHPSSGRGYYLPQGVNYEHFARPRPCPDELRALPRPIIGFAGGITARVDAPTVAALAEANPSGSIVLVGPADVPLAAMAAPNVHCIGARDYDELPAYVQAFDVGIIPYIESEWTRAVDPLKLLEYLAAGIPVVASDLPEIVKYADVVRAVPLGASFVRAVAEVLATPRDASAGRAVAAANTWRHRADRFLEIVDDLLGEPIARDTVHLPQSMPARLELVGARHAEGIEGIEGIT